MRKIFLSVLSCLMTVILLFTVAGCATEQSVSFTNAFDTEQALAPGGMEVCTYDVTLQKDYNEELAASSSLQNMMQYSAVGTFTTQLEMLNADKESEEQWQGSNLKDYDIKTVYKYTTTMSLTLTYDLGAGETIVQDEYTTVTWFASKDYTYAPIHSSSHYDYTVFTVNDGTVSADKYVYDYSIIYNKKSFKTSLVMNSSTSSSSKEYTFKKVTDNGQLLFLIRNLNVELGSNYTFPVKALSYPEAKNIAVYYNDNVEQSFNLNVNMKGNTFNGAVTVPYKNLTYRVSDGYNTGKRHYALVQSGSVSGLSHRALLLEYAEPLTTAGSLHGLGALVFKLNTVTVS